MSELTIGVTTLRKPIIVLEKALMDIEYSFGMRNVHNLTPTENEELKEQHETNVRPFKEAIKILNGK